MGPPEDVDDRLWIMARATLSDAEQSATQDNAPSPNIVMECEALFNAFDGRIFLTYNPHTLHGRIGAWFAADDVHVSLSSGDIHRSSDEAAAWMKGFPAGNEPDADEMFRADHPLSCRRRPEGGPVARCSATVSSDRRLHWTGVAKG